MILKPEPLSEGAFAPYGKVVSVNGSDSVTINDGYAQKHFELCVMDAEEKGGKATLHLYVAKQRAFPLPITMLEKHPYFSQTFMPRSKTPFLAVVALGDEMPDLSTLKAFMTDGEQGVHYDRGVWHFPLISLVDDEQFIVIDRKASDDEVISIEACIEYVLKQEIILNKE